MAAQVLLYERNGAGQSLSLTTATTPPGGGTGGIRMKKADNSAIDANDPLVKPSGGTIERSYEKWHRLKMGATGPTNAITVVVWYTDGTNNFGTGVSGYIRSSNPPSYATPQIPLNDAAGVDQFSYSPTGSQKAMGAGPYSAINTDFGDYAVTWLSLSSSVTAPQTLPAETIYWAWNET